MSLEIVPFVDEGLGHSSYLVDFGDGRALVVDPPRLPVEHLSAATARGLEIAYVADTHSHADYVSGAPELAARGATFLASRGANIEVTHRDVSAGEEVELAKGVTLRAIATPGHTPDHLAYLLLEHGDPAAFFSGGSLMVGTVGRTDLLGPEPREHLARQLYRALHDEILTLPDDLAVYPTHGAGSFCSAPGASERITTIGRERATNPLLAAPDEDTFVARLLGSFGTFPTYFSRLPEINRRGPRLYDTLPTLAPLGVGQTGALMRQGALIIDVRPIADFAAGHIPGSLSIELRPVFASWLGWLVDPDRPLVFVIADDQDRDDLVRQCLDVGYESLTGELTGALSAWTRAGHPEAGLDLVNIEDVRGLMLDVRQADEYQAGHVPNAIHIELGALPDASVHHDPMTVMCGHGERAMTGASILEHQGHRDLAVLAGGPEDWTSSTGQSLVTGP